MESEFAD
jgi:hypothetical protein